MKRSGRPKSATDERKQADVVAYVQEFPRQSLSEMAETSGISSRSVARILKAHKFHPYKMKLIHELNDDDPDRRLQFCEQFMQLCNEDPTLSSRICFSDEATFFLSGTVNRHNCRYWSQTNKHVYRVAHTQKPQKLNVWAGICGDKIIGPFFIEGNLTADSYLSLLQEHVGPAVMELFPETDIIFQQDGAPPHFALNVREYLDAVFPNQWIGRRGPYEWPPHSPNLAPPDFFLWGHLKTVVFSTQPVSLEDLRARIVQACQEITPQILLNVRQEFQNRLAYCQEENGAQFEHLL